MSWFRNAIANLYAAVSAPIATTRDIGKSGKSKKRPRGRSLVIMQKVSKRVIPLEIESSVRRAFFGKAKFRPKVTLVELRKIYNKE